MSALVKVIVPCYRYAEFLPGCVRSVLAQRGAGVRVLIIDDCSPDDTPAVAAALVAGDDRVQYRRHEVNQGLIATANEGLRWASDGDYTVLLSADDLLVPGALERAVTVMETRPRVGMVYGRSLYAREGRPLPSDRGRWRATDVWSGADWIRRRCASGHNCISSPEAVVRTTVQQAAGDYDPACTHCSDLQMWLRIGAISDIAYVRGTGQAIYRVSSQGMYRSAASPLVDLTERRAAFDTFFAGAGAHVPDATALHARARLTLARQALWQASRTIDRGGDALSRRLADELTGFALETSDRARATVQWRGLRLRRALGAGRSRYFPPLLATGAAHRARGHAAQLRWRLRGV